MAGVGAYQNSFRGPFVFDDKESIVENSTIRRLWPVGPMLHPPAQGQAVQRRPVVNVSLAVNYALDGLRARGYHAANLALHILAGLTLLGVVRRTLASPHLQARLGGQALALATVVAAIWVLHPIQTDAVTYIIQRTEVLAGLFYLLTLYAAIRSAHSPAPHGWYAAAVGACLLAMGSKESAVSAPLVVLLYDRVFLSGSWREVWRKRWLLYVGLASTWLLMLVMLPRGGEGSQIFGDSSARIQYALAQGESIVRYLALCFWPARLVVDYGFCPPQSVGRALPYLAAVGAILAATAWALWRRADLGFLGVWFFAILAPSSSVVPLPQQVAAEKRMYLPLAAVVTLVVTVAWMLWRALRNRLGTGQRSRLRAVPVVLAVALVVSLGLRTIARNEDYRTEERLWRSALAFRPENPRAHNVLAVALAGRGNFEEAAEHFREALRIKPDFADVHSNWGNALANQEHYEEAAEQFQKALQINPNLAKAYNNWGNALARQGRFKEAAERFEKAVQIAPNSAEARSNWGNALACLGRFDEAIEQYRQTLRINPYNAATYNNWGNALAAQGRLGEAAERFQKALQLVPDFVDARDNLRRVEEAAFRQSGQAPNP